MLVYIATGKHVSDAYGYEGRRRLGHGAQLSLAEIAALDYR